MICKPNHNIDASSEYNRLAREDERVGLILKDRGEYRHSIYFLIQAMEKYVRAKTKSDNEVIAQKLNALKAFLAGIDKFK